MKESELFIVGAGGQLGSALRAKYSLARYADVDKLDITDKHSVDSFDWSGIKYILNAAAYTNVDGAETTEGRPLAWAVNAVAVANLVRVCIEHNITLVHISSDYVFDGENSPHAEDEPFSPLGVYGQSKAAGDIVASTLPRHYILRTTWVIGEGNNFVRTMLKLAEKNVSPQVVSDQVGRLTFTSELVRAIDYLIVKSAPFGTYNVTNSGEIASWANITRAIFTLSGQDDLQVRDVTTSEYFANKDGVANRPLQSEMNLDKLSSLGFMFKDWREDLKAYIAKEQGRSL